MDVETLLKENREMSLTMKNSEGVLVHLHYVDPPHWPDGRWMVEYVRTVCVLCYEPSFDKAVKILIRGE